MERNLYRFTATRHGDKIETTLEYYSCDDEAIKIAQGWEEAFTGGIKVKVERIMPPTRDNVSSPVFIGIYETEKKRLALTERQQVAVKAVYDAIEKAQNLGVHFIEDDLNRTFAFNGLSVAEWDMDEFDNDCCCIPIEDLTHVGPPMWEMSVCDAKIYVKFKG